MDWNHSANVLEALAQGSQAGISFFYYDFYNLDYAIRHTILVWRTLEQHALFSPFASDSLHYLRALSSGHK